MTTHAMHPTQIEILESLRLDRYKQFSELLNDVAETSDNLTYHLKQLQKAGFIESPQKGEYLLAQKGVIYLNNNLELDQTIFPTVSCMLELTDQTGNLLVMKKLKQPFLGSLHYPTFGITSNQSLKHQIHLFLENYHIKAKEITFQTIYRDRKLNTVNDVVFDKFFMVFSGRLESFDKNVEDREFLSLQRFELKTSQFALFATKDLASRDQPDNFTETIHSE